MKPNAYQYPNTYEEFLKRQQDMHKEGIKAAQERVQDPTFTIWFPKVFDGEQLMGISLHIS